MYNQELKWEFLKEKGLSIKTREKYTWFFNRIAEFEEKTGKDFCALSPSEINEVMESIAASTRTNYLNTKIAYMYCEWCLSHNVPGATDNFKTISISGLSAARNNTVRSPLELQQFLDTVFDRESENTVGNMYRLYFWLGYSGLNELDAINLTPDNINLQEMVIEYDGDKFPIYRESLPALMNCINLTQITYKNPVYLKDVFRERASGNLLLRGYQSPEVKLMTLRTDMSRAIRFATEKGTTKREPLTYKKVWNSGVFYRMREREVVGLMPDFKKDARIAIKYNDYPNNKDRKYQVDRRDEALRAKVRGLKSDYELWKMTF